MPTAATASLYTITALMQFVQAEFDALQPEHLRNLCQFLAASLCTPAVIVPPSCLAHITEHHTCMGRRGPTTNVYILPFSNVRHPPSCPATPLIPPYTCFLSIRHGDKVVVTPW